MKIDKTDEKVSIIHLEAGDPFSTRQYLAFRLTGRGRVTKGNAKVEERGTQSRL